MPDHAIAGYDQFDFTPPGGGRTRTVYARGDGPGVLIMHELPGLSCETFDLGRRIADAGFRVYIPLLFGKAGQFKPIRSLMRLCISREWKLLAKRQSSPVTDWLRALCRHIYEERWAGRGGKRSGAGKLPGVGAIGMCLTGNFAIALMLDEALLAPVICQPSLPICFGKAALGVSDNDLACAKQRAAAGASLLGLRFKGDKISPPQRFETLRREFGDHFEGHELLGNKHSVLTHDFVDEDGHPTREALERVIAFLNERLS